MVFVRKLYRVRLIDRHGVTQLLRSTTKQKLQLHAMKSKQHPPKPIRAIRMAAPDRKTVKNLGEYSYAIPDVTKRTSPFKQTLMPALALVLSPLLLTVLLIYSLFMFLGPMSLRNRVLSTVIPYAMKSL